MQKVEGSNPFSRFFSGRSRSPTSRVARSTRPRRTRHAAKRRVLRPAGSSGPRRPRRRSGREPRRPSFRAPACERPSGQGQRVEARAVGDRRVEVEEHTSRNQRFMDRVVEIGLGVEVMDVVERQRGDRGVGCGKRIEKLASRKRTRSANGASRRRASSSISASTSRSVTRVLGRPPSTAADSAPVRAPRSRRSATQRRTCWSQGCMTAKS
jgi:hypothetical protein